MLLYETQHYVHSCEQIKFVRRLKALNYACVLAYLFVYLFSADKQVHEAIKAVVSFGDNP